MQVGEHAGGRLVGDLDGRLEDAVRDDVRLSRARRLGADEQAVVLVARHAALVHLLLQCRQPLRHQVHVLRHARGARQSTGWSPAEALRKASYIHQSLGRFITKTIVAVLVITTRDGSHLSADNLHL